MREILFRGKQKNNGEWIYGDLVTKQNICIANDWHEVIRVDDETVGQYTGLTDKNGKKIFDDDIVKDIVGGIYKVVYDTEYMRFAFEQDSIKWGLEGFDSVMDFEVIGNIYDNPELLGGAK